MRLFPELEAYRDRLVERAATWPDTPERDLLADLKRCRDQVALLERGIAELNSRLPEAARSRLRRGSEQDGDSSLGGPAELEPESRVAPATDPLTRVPDDSRSDSPGGAEDSAASLPADEVERLLRRIAVQSQMRDLTAAYAEVLRRHMAKPDPA